MNINHYDVIIIGAGAAGMFAAFTAGQRGRRVLLLDHNETIGEKIRISGGGRCNFTNINTSPAHFISQNPHFCRSALARYTPQDFTKLLQRHDIGYHEKTLGQLFCDNSAQGIIDMLQTECREANVSWLLGERIEQIEKNADGRFVVTTPQQRICSESLVIATGGLSIPQIGATGFGYHIAQQFGLRIVKTEPGLVPLTFSANEWQPYAELSGISIEAEVRCEQTSFRENILLTHRGISGPAILQISSYWQPGKNLNIKLLPELDFAEKMEAHKNSEQRLANVLAQWLPKRFAQIWCEHHHLQTPVKQLGAKKIQQAVTELHNWQVLPAGTLGYKKAEVTLGGVDTRDLSSKTLMANNVPGLFFIGEVVDVTGWLGGYNFQWAWASGFAAGNAA